MGFYNQNPAGRRFGDGVHCGYGRSTGVKGDQALPKFLLIISHVCQIPAVLGPRRPPNRDLVMAAVTDHHLMTVSAGTSMVKKNICADPDQEVGSLVILAPRCTPRCFRSETPPQQTGSKESLTPWIFLDSGHFVGACKFSVPLNRDDESRDVRICQPAGEERSTPLLWSFLPPS